MTLTPADLNRIANEYYLEFFGEEFPGWIEWSSHMKNIAGNCRSDGRIALNKKYYEKYGEEEIRKVIKHEICHLFCFNTIGRHNDETPYFQELVAKVGGSIKGKPMPISVYIYECPNCYKRWIFKKKVTKLFSCKTCSDGKYDPSFQIQLVSEEIIEPNFQ